jgi:hypothetical protein
MDAMASWEHFQRTKTTESQGWMAAWVFLEWQAQTKTLLFTKVRKMVGMKEDLDGRAEGSELYLSGDFF